MANEKILETIQGALSTMPAINIEQATEEEQRDLVHVLRSALSNKNPILVPPTTNNPTEMAKNPIEVPTMPHCSHCCDADQLSNMVTAILSSSNGAGACDICAQNAKMEVVMWVCLHCAKNFCAPEEDGKPQGHARRHASESEHWIATRILDPRAGFCFSCERDISLTVDGEVEGKKVIDTKVSFLVKGMRSRRNSPFNALIQNLLGLQIVHKIMMRPRTKGALSSPLRKFFMETNSCEEKGEEKKEEEDLLSTDDLFSNICSKWGGQHMDMNSEQLLVSILDALHTEDIQGIPWINPIPAATIVEEGERSFLEVATTDQNEKVEDGFTRFVCHGASQPYYHCYLKGIHSSGASSYVLHVPYSHIREFSPRLAMTVCNGYNRLMKSLKKAARSFLKKSLQIDLEPKLTLKILECPVKHQWLREYLKKNRSVELMEVYGHKQNIIYNPTPDYILVLQGIIWFILMKHKSGLSWNGGFTIDDIEVINGNIFIITKPPQKFTVAEELIEAMGKDFLTYAELFLNQLIMMVLSAHHKAHQVNTKYHVPYLTDFYELFMRMRTYSRFWSNDDLAERFRDFIRHHPFLKPPLVIAHFLSGIYSACRSHDDEDPDAAFKSIIEDCVEDWSLSLDLKNSMVHAVFQFKGEKMKANREEKKKQGIILEEEDPWPQNLVAMVEFIRHLFTHGPDYTKEGTLRLLQGQDCKTVPYGDKKPRKQLMRTLEETEVAVAVAVSKFVCKLMLTLLEENCILATWILPMWTTYKNSFSSSTPIDERAMEQWDNWWLQPDEGDEE